MSHSQSHHLAFWVFYFSTAEVFKVGALNQQYQHHSETYLNQRGQVQLEQVLEQVRQESLKYTDLLELPLLFQSESEVAQSCLILCDPMDCSLPSSSVHTIFQARVLEWVAISFSRRSS